MLMNFKAETGFKPVSAKILIAALYG